MLTWDKINNVRPLGVGQGVKLRRNLEGRIEFLKWGRRNMKQEEQLDWRPRERHGREEETFGIDWRRRNSQKSERLVWKNANTSSALVVFNKLNPHNQGEELTRWSFSQAQSFSSSMHNALAFPLTSNSRSHNKCIIHEDGWIDSTHKHMSGCVTDFGKFEGTFSSLKLF